MQIWGVNADYKKKYSEVGVRERENVMQENSKKAKRRKTL